MARLLIVYATTRGHTRKVAEAIARAVGEAGHATTVLRCGVRCSLARPEGYDAMIVAAPVRLWRHPPSVHRYLAEHLPALAGLPSAFFSVSLEAAGRGAASARRRAERFAASLGWRPRAVHCVAGAAQYSRMGALERIAVRLTTSGADGDADQEYTDWARLREEVDAFLAAFVPAPEPVASWQRVVSAPPGAVGSAVRVAARATSPAG